MGGGGESFNHSEEISPTRCRVAPTQSSHGLEERSPSSPEKRHLAQCSAGVLRSDVCYLYIADLIARRTVCNRWIQGSIRGKISFDFYCPCSTEPAFYYTCYR